MLVRIVNTTLKNCDGAYRAAFLIESMLGSSVIPRRCFSVMGRLGGLAVD